MDILHRFLIKKYHKYLAEVQSNGEALFAKQETIDLSIAAIQKHYLAIEHYLSEVTELDHLLRSALYDTFDLLRTSLLLSGGVLLFSLALFFFSPDLVLVANGFTAAIISAVVWTLVYYVRGQAVALEKAALLAHSAVHSATLTKYFSSLSAKLLKIMPTTESKYTYLHNHLNSAANKADLNPADSLSHLRCAVTVCLSYLQAKAEPKTDTGVAVGTALTPEAKEVKALLAQQLSPPDQPYGQLSPKVTMAVITD